MKKLDTVNRTPNQFLEYTKGSYSKNITLTIPKEIHQHCEHNNISISKAVRYGLVKLLSELTRDQYILTAKDATKLTPEELKRLIELNKPYQPIPTAKSFYDCQAKALSAKELIEYQCNFNLNGFQISRAVVREMEFTLYGENVELKYKMLIENEEYKCEEIK